MSGNRDEEIQNSLISSPIEEINDFDNNDCGSTDTTCSSEAELSDSFTSNDSLENDSKNGETIETNDTEDTLDHLIYESSSIKISQFNLLLSLFISRFKLSKLCSNVLLKLIAVILPQPNKVTKKMENLYVNNNSTKTVKKFVGSGCWMVKTDLDVHCDNAICIFNVKNKLKETGLEVIHLDTTQQLESILKREKLSIIKYKNVIDNTNFRFLRLFNQFHFLN